MRSPLSGAGLVVHGGGPTPVLNASLTGVIEESSRHPEITALFGARFGVQGVLEEAFIDLGRQPADLVRRIGESPGSALGSCRREIAEEDYARILAVLRRRGIRYLFYNGGNGSMYAAHRIWRAAVNAGWELCAVGIPKTIDNDLAETDHSPGYGSAARFVACAVRDIGGDLKALRGRITVIETMGRNVGWLAAASVLARHCPDDPPHLIYVPERRISEDQLMAEVEAVYARLNYAVIVVCEGQLDDRGEPFGADAFLPDGFQRRLSANLGHAVAQRIEKRLGLRTRSEKPGLLGRSSASFVSATDREEAHRCGVEAVRAAAAGVTGKMITLMRESGGSYRCRTGLADLEKVAYTERPFPEEWIAPAGNDVLPAFAEWVRPLAGEIESHPRF